MTEETMSLCMSAELQAEKYPDVPAFSFNADGKNVSVTRREFALRVRAAASYLAARGISGRVCILSENSIGFVTALFALWRAGCTAVILNPGETCSGLAYEMKTAGSTAVIFSDMLREKAAGAVSSAPAGITEICLDELPDEITGCDTEPAVLPPADTAVIMFTSGSTGRPHGVMMSPENIMHQADAVIRIIGKGSGTVAVLPFCHVYAFMTSLLAPYFGGSTVYICTEPRRFVRDIVKFRPDYLSLVPAFVKMLIKGAEKLPGGTLREKLGGNTGFIYCGGAAVTDDIYDAFDNSGVLLCNGYGLTECCGAAAVNTSAHYERGSIGYPLSCNEIHISDRGEILVRGGNISGGYLCDEEKTAEAFRDGWFHTGDLGRIDENGMLWYTGRIKNLIILSNGVNVPAEALEAMFGSADYVLGVRVFGCNDIITAEIFPDFSVPDVRTRINEDMRRINMGLQESWRIGRIIIRETDFRRSASGKIIAD